VTEATRDEPGRWLTFGEREIYQSPWVWLGQADVGLPDGGRYWHHVVRLPPVVMMALLDRGRVLLLWRHRFIQDRWGWELPGGLIDAGEEPAEAAARELAEETGYRARSVAPLIAFQPRSGTVDSQHFIFTGRDPDRIGEPTERNEFSRLEWVPLASVPALIDAGQMWDAGTQLALLRLLLTHEADGADGADEGGP
jgi:8-oxo-dGTP pyrophosphatase MutT (NUDIX family)